GVTEVFHLVPIDPITGKATTPLLRIEEPGTYCFRADYMPDATAPYAAGSHTDTTNECFTVTKTTLTVNKVVVPSSDTGLFNLQIDGVTDTPPTGGVGNGGTTGPVVVSPGSHTEGETAGPGPNQSDYTTVISGDCAANGSVTLAAGDNKTCTITNTRKGTIVIIKTTVNGSATFSYTGTGSGIPPSFTIPPSQTFSGLTTGAAGGSRSVTEPVLLLPTGWVF